LATGKLLVASRRLRDPNFAETVILLLAYSQDGAIGVVINRPTTVRLATVLSEVEALKTRKDLVYIGGPVGRDQMLLLARTAQEPADSKQILSNVYLVSSQKALQQLVENNDSSLQLHAYAGYAGWAPKQLDAEVARGDWHISAADATLVFDTPADQVWPKLINRSEFEWTHNPQNNERTTYSLY
jgi:putative transcriptional regulator